MSAEPEQHTLATMLDELFRMAHPSGRKWTNAEVAAEIKAASPDLRIGAVYLSQLRTGKRTNPSHELLAALARFFGVPIGYFFDGQVAESVRVELAALEVMRQAGVRALAMRAAGLPEEHLQAVTAILDQYREMQRLPPVKDVP
jgi:transcriptional regulator with XRE-family HTH domain